MQDDVQNASKLFLSVQSTGKIDCLNKTNIYKATKKNSKKEQLLISQKIIDSRNNENIEQNLI